MGRLFFLGLSRWKIEKNRKQCFLLFLTQGLGIFGTLAMAMSGLFPISFPALHSFLSACLYILLGTAFGFSVSALRYQPTCPRWLLAVGVSTALVDMLFGFFHTVTVLEWATVALLLCYVGLVGVETNRLSSAKMDRSPTAAIR